MCGQFQNGQKKKKKKKRKTTENADREKEKMLFVTEPSIFNGYFISERYGATQYCFLENHGEY